MCSVSPAIKMTVALNNCNVNKWITANRATDAFLWSFSQSQWDYNETDCAATRREVVKLKSLFWVLFFLSLTAVVAVETSSRSDLHFLFSSLFQCVRFYPKVSSPWSVLPPAPPLARQSAIYVVRKRWVICKCVHLCISCLFMYSFPHSLYGTAVLAF